MKGGYRPGAGRRKGFVTIKAETARKICAARISADIEPILSALIHQAKTVDVRAAQLLFDRVFGKTMERLELETIQRLIHFDS